MRRIPAARKALVGLGIVLCLTGCKEEWCLTSGNLRCEGDVLVYCPGGRGTLDFTANRKDCRKEGKRCVAHAVEAHGIACRDVLGWCDPTTFKPFCRPYGPAMHDGSMVLCRNGEMLAIGPSCKMPEAPNAAGK